MAEHRTGIRNSAMGERGGVNNGGENTMPGRVTSGNQGSFAEPSKPEVEGSDFLHAAVKSGDCCISIFIALFRTASVDHSLPISEQLHAGSDILCDDLCANSDGR